MLCKGRHSPKKMESVHSISKTLENQVSQKSFAKRENVIQYIRSRKRISKEGNKSPKKNLHCVWGFFYVGSSDDVSRFVF
jgi:hypothetical protein